MNKKPFLISIVLFGVYFSLKVMHVNHWIAISVFLIPIVILLISFFIRKKLKYKNWFLSPKNWLIEKNENVIVSDIEPSLLYEKVLEVIGYSEFTLFDFDLNSRSIVCGTPVNFTTWGENIYLNINEGKDNSSEILIVTTTIFGSTSWGRNEKNQRSFFDNLEDSLTV